MAELVIRMIAIVILFTLLVGFGGRTMILWNPRTGQCDEMPKAAAYAMGGTKDVDAWWCEGLKDGDMARTEKPTK